MTWRIVLIGLVSAWILLAADSVAWLVTSGGREGLGASSMTAALGGASLVGLLGGLLGSLLSWAARADGPARVLCPGAAEARVSPVMAVLAVVSAGLVLAIGPAVKVTLRPGPALAALVDLLTVVSAYGVLRRRLLRSADEREPDLRTRSVSWLLPALGAVAAFGGGALFRQHLVSSSTWDLVVIASGGGLVAVLLLRFPGSALTLPPQLRPAGRVALAAGFALALAALFLLGTRPSARAGAAQLCRPASWVLSAGARLDLDGDGFSAIFGGGDCDDFDADVSPTAPEIPGNHVDDNCIGGDVLSGSPFPARPSYVALPAGVTPPRHILLVSVDALRADHLGVYGYRRGTSPNLDAWSKKARVYRRAYSSAPETDLAMPILLSGRLLPLIPWDRSVWPGAFPKNMPTVASLLAAEGFSTGAVVTHRYFNAGLRWTQGFQQVDRSLVKDYVHLSRQSSAPEVVAIALRWIRAHANERWFLWLHLYDPHQEYVRQPDAPDYGDRDVDRYDGEIFHTDRAFGSLFDGLASAGIEGSTAVVVLADHGEEFGEHGGRFHGGRMWQEVTRIPLLVRVPGIAPGTVDCPTAHVDVPATLLNLAGVDPAAHGLSGSTLLADLLSPCDPHRQVVSELRYGARPMSALIGRRYKLVQDATLGTYQLFDLKKDPRERVSLVQAQPAVFERMRRRLQQWNEHVAGQEIARALDRARVPEVPAADRVGAVFEGGIELAGAHLRDVRMPSEEILVTRLYWRITGRPQSTCLAALHFDDPAGKEIRSLKLRERALNGLLSFRNLPHGRILADEHSSIVRLRKRGKVRARLGIDCLGRMLAVVRGRSQGRDFVDLGEIEAGGTRIR